MGPRGHKAGKRGNRVGVKRDILEGGVFAGVWGEELHLHRVWGERADGFPLKKAGLRGSRWGDLGTLWAPSVWNIRGGRSSMNFMGRRGG